VPTASQLTDAVAEHGEGPVWDVAGQRLLCVDMNVGDLLAVDVTDGSVRRASVADTLAALRPRTSGGWVAAVRRRFAVIEDVDALLAGTASPRMLEPLWDDEGVRFNEGGCDPQGRFFCGSMAFSAEEGAGSLWRLDPDGSTARVLEGVTISNGLAWTPDGSRAYYIDTPTGRVDLLHVDPVTGEVTGREPFATIPEGPGGPDGLVLDAEGGVWVALYEGGGVLRFDADGALTERVNVPTPLVTAVTFGGPDLDALFITTSAQEESVAQDPLAGALFTHAPGVRGLAPLPYAG